jgi:ABC-2 type transport system permease protein
MLAEIKELIKYRELLYVMVQRELRIRYKNSALGILWSFLNPLFQVLVMSFVFNTFVNEGRINNYTAYILAAYLPYLFFQQSLLDSAQSVLSQIHLIKKIYFPREILPIASVISNFIHFLLGLLILFGLLLFAYVRNPKVFPIQPTVLYLPVLLAIIFCLTLGLSLIISALNTFYEDVKYIVQIVLYAFFYLCPILYFAERVANSARNVESNFLLYKLYNLNPMAALCHGFRKCLLAPTDVMVNGQLAKAMPTPWKYIAIAGIFSVITLVIGYSMFSKLKWKFVERP